MTTKDILVAVIGLDQPGVVAATAETLTRLDCNIEQMTQTTLRHQFTSIYLVNKPEGLDNDNIVLELRTAFQAKKFHLSVSIRDYEEPKASQVIEGEPFVFEELKRIKDGRLLKKYDEPEILTQIDNYRAFLSENKDELTVYYRTLYKIKKKLGLPVPLVDDIDKVTVDVEPQLSIALNYDKSTKARDERVKKIKDLLLKERNVIPIIYENF